MNNNGIIIYDIALIEKPGVNGLNRDNISLLYGLTTRTFSDGTDEVFPIELEAREHESSAMGFITPKAAEKLDYDYEHSGLHDFIASILDDMNNEVDDNHYIFKGLDIYLSR